MEPETLPCPPLGAIPRAQVAVLLLQDAITGQLDPDETLAAAERQLWLSWCSRLPGPGRSGRRAPGQRAGRVTFNAPVNAPVNVLHEPGPVGFLARRAADRLADAVKFVVADAEDPDGKLQFANADQASLDLHNRVRALIEQEKAKGNVLSYIEAVRRVERERVKRK